MRLMEGQDAETLRLIASVQRRTAQYSQEHSFAIQNWIRVHVLALRPVLEPTATHALALWPPRPATRPEQGARQMPRRTAHGAAERRLHAMFGRLCAVAYGGTFPEVAAIRADCSILMPGQLRLELSHDCVRFTVDVNPLFAPDDAILAHVLLHEMEHIHQLCSPPSPTLDAEGHGSDFERSLAAHSAAATKAGIHVVDAYQSRELPAWWADVVRGVLDARQRTKFEAMLALDAGGTDLWVAMAQELDCSVDQIAAAYLSCVGLATYASERQRADRNKQQPPPPGRKKPPEGTTYTLWRALGGA